MAITCRRNSIRLVFTLLGHYIYDTQFNPTILELYICFHQIFSIITIINHILLLTHNKYMEAML